MNGLHVYHDWFRAIPKVELHLHIDGALQTQMAWELWRSWSEERRRQHPEFPQTWWELSEALGNRSIRPNQEALLEAFIWPSLLLQTPETLSQVTRELLRAKSADGVIYCELRYAPVLHIQQGYSIEAGLEAILQAMQETQDQVGIRSRLIVCGMRHFMPEQNLHWLESVFPYAEQGVVAVDLAGVEAKHPDPRVHSRFFARARERGLAVTFHGGEIWESLPILKQSILELKPERIAHGSTLVQAPEILQFLRDQSIALDLCPTSNLQASLYPSYESFPFAVLQEQGVFVTLSTDDWVVSRLSLSEEYENLYRAGVTMSALLKSNLDAAQAAFLPEKERRELRTSIEAWYRQDLGEDWEEGARAFPRCR